MEAININVRDFSVAPGSRERDEGPYSGEAFREDFLISSFKEARDSNRKLMVNLDGTIGYGTSWLEEVFGGLAREFGSDTVLETLDYISEEEPYLIDDIKHYIKHAEKSK